MAVRAYTDLIRYDDAVSAPKADVPGRDIRPAYDREIGTRFGYTSGDAHPPQDG